MSILKPFSLLAQILAVAFLMSGCKCGAEYKVVLKDYFSSQREFRSALVAVDSLIRVNKVVAYLDTLPDGEPNRAGRTRPLSEYVYSILAQIDSGRIESAMHDVFRFDGSPFSLISYLIKAERVRDISPATLAQIVGAIPLPPSPVDNYTPPVVPVPGEVIAPPACPCAPKVKIKVTWAYRPSCGNYTKEITGYAARNILTGMRRGTVFRFDAEVDNCDEGGTWENRVAIVGLTSYGIASYGGNNVSVIAESAGTFDIWFTYRCQCGCARLDSKKFSISFN